MLSQRYPRIARYPHRGQLELRYPLPPSPLGCDRANLGGYRRDTLWYLKNIGAIGIAIPKSAIRGGGSSGGATKMCCACFRGVGPLGSMYHCGQNNYQIYFSKIIVLAQNNFVKIAKQSLYKANSFVFSCKQGKATGSNITDKMFWWNFL